MPKMQTRCLSGVKKQFGYAYVDEQNLFLSIRGYNRLKKNQTNYHYEGKLAGAKIFDNCIHDTWPLLNKKLEGFTFQPLFEVHHEAEDQPRPLKGDMVSFLDDLSIYEIVHVSLCMLETGCFKLLLKKTNYSQ